MAHALAGLGHAVWRERISGAVLLALGVRGRHRMTPEDFIRANAALMAPPLVPEIKLYLATEVVPLWRKTEEELAEMGVPPPYWAFAWAGGQALARYVLDNPALVRGQARAGFRLGLGPGGDGGGEGRRGPCAGGRHRRIFRRRHPRQCARPIDCAVATTSDDMIGADRRLGRHPGGRHVSMSGRWRNG